MTERRAGVLANVWSIAEQIGERWQSGRERSIPTETADQSSELLAADQFSLSDFFAHDSEEPLFQSGPSPLVNRALVSKDHSNQSSQVGGAAVVGTIQEQGNEVMSSPRSLAAVWRAMAEAGQQRFTKSVTASSFQAGASLAESTIGWLGTAIGACGPLCFHGLSAAGSALGSGGIGGGMRGGLGEGLFGGQASSGFDWGSAALELERSGSFWLGDRKVTWQDLLWVWSHSMSEGLYHMLGFGIIDCIIDGLLPGQSRQSAQLV